MNSVIRIVDGRDERTLAALLDRSAKRDLAFERRVARIVSDVRRRGDAAVLSYAKRFDKLTDAVEVTRTEMERGAASVESDVRRAIAAAARNIRHVARRQVPRDWTTRPVSGVTVAQRVTPLERVGCYVPGGRYPLPSSLLMTAIPASVAGVAEIIVVCPKPDPVVMAAALEAGVTRLFRIGGAHAIAAMAFGTRTVPRVDKIVGPGNRYVAASKALVANRCAIDFYAGPTEIVIVAGAGRPSWIAADLVAQAEHDPDARAIFVTWSRRLATRVAGVLERASRGRTIVARSLRAHGAIVVTRSADEAMQFANALAPEHLVVDRDALTRRPLTAGAVFVGAFSAQAAGDYATGSNHVLPTAGAARFRGGLSAADFVRQITVQRVTRAGLRAIGGTVMTLAAAEGLHAHAASIGIRVK